MRFAQRRQPVLALEQVIERAEQQHPVLASIRLPEVARVPDLAGHAITRLCLSDVPFDRIDNVHPVALRRQPLRMNTRGSAQIQHRGGRRRKVASDELLGPNPLKDALSAAAQTIVLIKALGVERGDVRIDLGHRATRYRRPRPGER